MDLAGAPDAVAQEVRWRKALRSARITRKAARAAAGVDRAPAA